MQGKASSRKSVVALVCGAMMVGLAGPAATWGANSRVQQTSAAQPAAGQAASDAKPVDPKVAGEKALNTAVAALLKEYKDKKMRTKADYFGSSVPDELTQDIIIEALNRNLGPDAAGDGYIKWQLLSAIPGKIDEKLLDKAGNAFINHPAFMERPGVSLKSRREIYEKTRKGNEAAVAQLNTQFSAKVAEIAAYNAPIVHYVDDLFLKMQDNFPVIAAGFGEIMNRAELGVESGLPSAVLGATRTWASGNPNPQQLNAVSNALGKLIEKMGGAPKTDATPITPDFNDDHAEVVVAAGHAAAPAKAEQQDLADTFPPKMFTTASYDDKGKQIVWKAVPVTFITVKQAQDLKTFIDQLIANPGGGLQFKPAEK